MARPRTHTTRRTSRTVSVQVGRVGTRLKTVTVPEGSTVDDVLEKVGLQPKETEELRLNGDDVDYDEEVQNNDAIMIVKSIEGGH